MQNGLQGNYPNRKIFWKTQDGRTQIIRYCDGVFGLEYDEKEVMPETTFDRVQAYVWAEFIDWAPKE
jgi:hypothetical protein